MQVGMGVGERLTAAGIAISSGSKVETTNVDRASEGIELNSPPDILIGDLDYHRYHLFRSCNPPMASPMHYPQAKYFQGPRYWEGSGRLNGNIPPYMGMNMLHPLGGLAPSLHSLSRMGGGNYPPRGFASYGNEETSPKPRGGTGTYLPNPVRITACSSLLLLKYGSVENHSIFISSKGYSVGQKLVSCVGILIPWPVTCDQHILSGGSGCTQTIVLIKLLSPNRRSFS